MPKYISKQLEIEAEVVTKENWENVVLLLGNKIHQVRSFWKKPPFYIEIPTLEGTMRAEEGDYLVKGTHGEFYPVKPDIFKHKYLPAAGPADGLDVLKGAICYLAGPIEQSKDFGVGWRDNFISACAHRGLDIKFINPCKKPEGCMKEVDDGSSQRIVDILREEEKWDELQKFVKPMRREDLRFVALNDFLVLYVNPDIHMCGSYEEYFLAEYQRKPIFVIVEGGLKKMPLWLFGSLDSLDTVFADIDSCADYLTRLNSGEIPLDDKWLLVRDYLDKV